MTTQGSQELRPVAAQADDKPALPRDRYKVYRKGDGNYYLADRDTGENFFFANRYTDGNAVMYWVNVLNDNAQP